MRTVILHGHMFKNAGTTFDWSLHRNFKRDFCDHRDDKDMRDGGREYLESFLDKKDNIKALSSHHLSFPLTSSDNFNFIKCHLLRNPILRIKSVYDFERQQKSKSLGAITAKKMEFLDYVLWRMRDDVPNTIRNYQTAYISEAQRGKAKLYLNDHHFRKAASSISSNPFIGLVEKYDESMVFFEHSFSEAGIELDLSYVAQNVMSDKAQSLDDKFLKILDELGTEANYIFSKNLYDYRLYLAANARLQSRVQKINDFDIKLASFRERCENLREKV